MCSKGNIYTTLSSSNKDDLKPCNWRNTHKKVHVLCVFVLRVLVWMVECACVCVFGGGGGGGNGGMLAGGVKCKFKTLKYTNL